MIYLTYVLMIYPICQRHLILHYRKKKHTIDNKAKYPYFVFSSRDLADSPGTIFDAASPLSLGLQSRFRDKPLKLAKL